MDLVFWRKTGVKAQTVIVRVDNGADGLVFLGYA